MCGRGLNCMDNLSLLQKGFKISVSPGDNVIALAGNPNTGKSTIFNTLTGMKQHTGNWPGKTVLQAQGSYKFNNKEYILVDLPGIYSLLPGSPDEEVARDFICFGCPDCTIVVTDATCLERNLNLVLQVMEITPRVVVCLNLIDEAERKGIAVDAFSLSRELGVPVVLTVALNGRGIEELKKTVGDVAGGKVEVCPRSIEYDAEVEKLVKEIESHINPLIPRNLINFRWLALRIIDDDKKILEAIRAYFRLEGEILI